MHVCCNACEGEKRDGCTALVCKGLPRGRRKEIEKMTLDPRVPMHFEKNAWTCAITMVKLAEEFLKYMKDKHDGLGCLLFCDDLSAHVSDEVKDAFHKGNVFACCLPAQTTESHQSIDAGHCMYLRCSIGNMLDWWLLSETNMEKWEGKMTVSERRVLINNFVTEATGTTIKKDDLRIGCFECTGCLMHSTTSDADDKIRPQGVTSKIHIHLTHTLPYDASDFVSPLETTSPEEDIEGNVSEHELYESSEAISEGDLVVDEEEIELITTEVLKDVGVVYSDDDLDLRG